MSLHPFRFGMCLVLCLGCLVGIYHLQAEIGSQAGPRTAPSLLPASQPTFQRQEERRLRTETASLFTDDIHSDFYQTIIRNNLFAPLGRNLHQKRVPSAHLKLMGTFVCPVDPLASTAWIQETETATYQELFLTDTIDGFMLIEIQAKHVTLEKADETVTLKLETGLFLNLHRR